MAAAALASCGSNARIEGTLSDAPSSEVIVKLLNVNHYDVLDTVKTDAKGRYEYKLPVESGQPEFIYLFYKNTRIASMLLQKGDKVNVVSDTLGTYSVTGSDETLKLMDVEKDEAEFNNRFFSASARLADLNQSSQAALDLKKEITAQYIDYYRSRVKYVLQNSHSLTCIPVLYQTVGDAIPVFSQSTDAIHFRNISDSLKAVYPDSKYVKALAQEADRRMKLLNLDAQIKNAGTSGFPDMELPDVNGKKVKLSSLDTKMVMIYFWNSADAAQKMFNQDVMKPVYNEYHQKGFDIYSVSVDADKASWASVVKSQNLPWTNVSDVSGSAAALYNVTSLPMLYFIENGSIVQAPGVKDGSTLRAFLKARM